MIEVHRSPGPMPAPGEVETLYALACGAAPDSPAAEAAEVYAALYDLSLDRADTLVVSATTLGELVGFAYTHPWRWAEQTDSWSQEWAALLGADALTLEGSNLIGLIAVHPQFTRKGLGFELLKRVLIGSSAPIHWLQSSGTDSAATRLFTRIGFRSAGAGPSDPDGSPTRLWLHG